MVAHRWLAAALWLSLACGVSAQNTDCLSAFGNTEIRGNLNVAVACTLTGTEIRGNVTVFAGGSLTARDARIRGNLNARRADFVDITGSQIDGNVRLEELVGDRSTLDDSDLGGNVQLNGNRSLMEVFDNEIDGNLRVVGNVGGVVISGNAIDGNLECSRNDPAPIGGANHRIRRRANGQCANLQSPSVPPRPPAPPAPPAPPSPPPAVVTPPVGPASPPVTPTAPPVTPRTPPEIVAARPDLTPPTLTLRGSATVDVLIDSPYKDDGAIAIDDIDGDLTSRIVIASNVDTQKLGIYTVTYSVTDHAGNAAKAVSRTVNVTPANVAQEGPGGGGALAVELGALLLLLWRRRQS